MEKIFAYQDKKVRTIIKDGEPLFCLADVSDVLGLTNAYRQAARNIKGVHDVHTLTSGGSQSIKYISEPVLYRLIFRSTKLEAQAFQDWVFDVVLPAIRKTGKYEIPKHLKIESTEKRKELTDAWKESGIEKPWQYGSLTKEEYKNLGFPEDLRKPDMNQDQIMILMALETFEKVNLHFNKKHGYLECRESLKTTSEIVNSIKSLEK